MRVQIDSKFGFASRHKSVFLLYLYSYFLEENRRIDRLQEAQIALVIFEQDSQNGESCPPESRQAVAQQQQDSQDRGHSAHERAQGSQRGSQLHLDHRRIADRLEQTRDAQPCRQPNRKFSSRRKQILNTNNLKTKKYNFLM